MQEGVKRRNCAVFDVGKSFAKLSVVSADGRILAERRIIAPTMRTPHYNALDTESLFAWLVGQLKTFASYNIDRIIPVAHGSACAFLDEGGNLIQPVQDYEWPIPDAFAEAYAAARPSFAETLSPALPKGLNLGAQIFWHSRRDPAQFRRVRWIVPYPQYWAWRLSGAVTCEITSLGCHSDLWSPATNGFSSLVQREGWADRFGPLKSAWDMAGSLLPEISAVTGLAPDVRICVGLHDSNSALAAVISGWQGNEAPALLSTGTWFVAMAPGGSLDGLQADRDCMGAVDAFGQSVPCSRFMGGRAFETITRGMSGGYTDTASLIEVMRDAALALPSFLDAGGPFPGRRGEIRNLRHDTPRTRTALGMLYQALVSQTCLDMIQSGRPLIIEGVAARNPVLCGLMAALHDGPVYYNTAASAVTLGASALAWHGEAPAPHLQLGTADPLLERELSAYRRLWTQACAETVAA